MNALVTGASSGIGLEIARLLAARGYHLLLAARRREELESLAAELPYGATVYPCDLAEPGSAARLHEQVESQVDVLVNNAGFGKVGRHTELSLEAITEMAHLNVVTLTELCRLFGADMRARGSGHIMNVASVAAFMPLPYFAEYAASKAYVLSFSEALAWELGASGVVVSCLCPGPTETGFASVARPQKGKLFNPRTVMTAAEVAQEGVAGLFAGQRVVVTGRRNQLMALLGSLLPRRLVLALGARNYGRAL